MSDLNFLLLWSDNATVSTLVWAVVIVGSLYLGRTPAIHFLGGVQRSVRATARFFAAAVRRTEQRVAHRNREVLQSSGQEHVEKQIEREFHRVNTIVKRDLGTYPALHRKISEVIEKIEGDYRDSTETPPAPPAWLEAVEAIAKIPRTHDDTVGKILNDLQDSLKSAHKETLGAYNKRSSERQQLLKRMIPSWRDVSGNLKEVDNTIRSLLQRITTIDDHMKHFESIRQGEDKTLRRLAASSITQFFTAGLVLFIAILGGIINFQLIALPMSEMVGGTSQLGPMRTADVAALVIIMVEVAMGLFLLESLRITHLFPVIGSMDDSLRKRMIIITFSILFILASVEASLAYMRDLLALDRESLSQTLSGISAVQAEFRWIPSIGQMTMGFILPFTLAFVAIPLESFIHASRTVAGALTELALRAVYVMVRMVGQVAASAVGLLIALYDVIIFLPLHIERSVGARAQKKVEQQLEVKDETPLALIEDKKITE